jgi:hypothetical protein
MLLFQSFAQNFEPTFETAYIVGDLQTMEKLYKKSDRDNFYLDCALEEGRLNIYPKTSKTEFVCISNVQDQWISFNYKQNI